MKNKIIILTLLAGILCTPIAAMRQPKHASHGARTGSHKDFIDNYRANKDSNDPDVLQGIIDTYNSFRKNDQTRINADLKRDGFDIDALRTKVQDLREAEAADLALLKSAHDAEQQRAAEEAKAEKEEEEALDFFARSLKMEEQEFETTQKMWHENLIRQAAEAQAQIAAEARLAAELALAAEKEHDAKLRADLEKAAEEARQEQEKIIQERTAAVKKLQEELDKLQAEAKAREEELRKHKEHKAEEELKKLEHAMSLWPAFEKGLKEEEDRLEKAAQEKAAQEAKNKALYEEFGKLTPVMLIAKAKELRNTPININDTPAMQELQNKANILLDVICTKEQATAENADVKALAKSYGIDLQERIKKIQEAAAAQKEDVKKAHEGVLATLDELYKEEDVKKEKHHGTPKKGPHSKFKPDGSEDEFVKGKKNISGIHLPSLHAAPAPSSSSEFPSNVEELQKYYNDNSDKFEDENFRSRMIKALEDAKAKATTKEQIAVLQTDIDALKHYAD